MKMCVRCGKIDETGMQFCTEDGNPLVVRNFYGSISEFGNADSIAVAQESVAIALPPSRNAQEMRCRAKRNLRVALLGALVLMIVLSGGFVWAAIQFVVTNRAAEKTAVSNESAIVALAIVENQGASNLATPATAKKRTPKK